MKKFLLYLTLLMTYGCQYGTPTQASSNGCSETPETVLPENNVKPISLNSQPLKISGQASANTSIGYTFEAKTGQKLDYQTTEDICIWVYSPDNQLLKGKDLPQTGRYTVQISPLQGDKTFEINMSVGSSKFQPFSKADFPKSSCGDSKPTDPSVYPINFYPVNVPYSEDNLARVRSSFCADAYQKISKDTRQPSVQIASFLIEEKAIAFADLVKTEIPEASVGSPTSYDK